ncbi:MAG: Holliday junction branch migration protein RuvA [Nitrospiraceae bacterium]|nr:Holliday junction branch migration protein RuvA [Nitrospiraceae bacterium]
MIGHIRGKVGYQWDHGVVIDVNGIGYEVQMPSSSLKNLPPIGEEVEVFTHLLWKEDSVSLYGFKQLESRDMFRLLLAVSGVGPKLALNILSILSAGELLHILAQEKRERLQAIQGVGKKTAARLCVDLKEKAKARLLERHGDIGPAGPGEKVGREDLWDDAFSALIHLGYHPSQVKVVLAKVLASTDIEPDLEGLVRRALQYLAKSPRQT